MQDTETTTVLFRRDRSRNPQITAVFPELPSDDGGSLMTCYSHIGQHGACNLDWYYTTIAASPIEYTPLQKELESIGYRLKIAQRLSKRMSSARRLEARR